VSVDQLIAIGVPVAAFLAAGLVAWGRVRSEVDRVVSAIERVGETLERHADAIEQNGNRLTRVETQVEEMNRRSRANGAADMEV
jgi:CII-binding regulator of phage lambda lysogenization HflD